MCWLDRYHPQYCQKRSLYAFSFGLRNFSFCKYMMKQTKNRNGQQKKSWWLKKCKPILLGGSDSAQSVWLLSWKCITTKADGDVRKRSPYSCWWGCKLVQTLWKSVKTFLQKLNREWPYDPATPLLGIHPKVSISSGRDSCT